MSRWSQSELCCCSLMPSRRMKASEPQVPGPKNGHGNQNSLRVHSESLIKNWGLISRRRRAWKSACTLSTLNCAAASSGRGSEAESRDVKCQGGQKTAARCSACLGLDGLKGIV